MSATVPVNISPCWDNYRRIHATGEYSISDLAELFSVSRPTVYRTLNRRHSP